MKPILDTLRSMNHTCSRCNGLILMRLKVPTLNLLLASCVWTPALIQPAVGLREDEFDQFTRLTKCTKYFRQTPTPNESWDLTYTIFNVEYGYTGD